MATAGGVQAPERPPQAVGGDFRPLQGIRQWYSSDVAPSSWYRQVSAAFLRYREWLRGQPVAGVIVSHFLVSMLLMACLEPLTFNSCYPWYGGYGRHAGVEVRLIDGVVCIVARVADFLLTVVAVLHFSVGVRFIYCRVNDVDPLLFYSERRFNFSTLACACVFAYAVAAIAVCAALDLLWWPYADAAGRR